jgi:hypothetical protein
MFSHLKADYEEFLSCLRRYCITSVDHKSEEKCIVCMEKLCDVDGCHKQDHEEPARLSCGHIIGMNCAVSWFAESQQCPMCRAEVLEYSGPKGGHWF